MPPLRTTPPAKAIKTERTHEENQERAYIAASRRSDRSLEARVESARRASEIHKRRTGRSLRVTEQDVINEEMYEEEDDDLPMQYRRLTAHLQTGSADFNRRLAAYLTNQVAMRSAMEQMVQNSYGQQYSNIPYQHNSNAFPSPMLPPQNIMQSPQPTYRPGPYPNPHHSNFRSNHGRALSMASIPNQNQGSTSPPTTNQTTMADQRRMSTPATINASDVKPDPEYMRQPQSANSFQPLWQDMGPFTTSLPPESQQMLAHAPGFDSNDPSYNMLMRGSDQYISDPYYPWHDMQGAIKGMPVHPSHYPGMSATLAPAALEHAVDSKVDNTTATTTSSTPAATTQPLTPGAPTSGLEFNFSQESKAFNFGAGLGSGQVTPGGEGFWDHFVMDGSWDDGAANASPEGVGG